MLPQEKKNQDFFHGVPNISSLFAKQFQRTYVLSFLTFYCHYLHIAATKIITHKLDYGLVLNMIKKSKYFCPNYY